MKRLILDHFRRWWWVLALVALLEFGLGWFMAGHPGATFEFWAFMLALWSGANLLTFDLKRGLLRAVGPLPLTAGQIGRGWWLATVPIPAVTLAALLFAGAATHCQVHPEQVFPARNLALAGLFTLVWLGITFTMVFPRRGFAGTARDLARNLFIGGLSMLTFFGSMMFALDLSKSPLKSILLMGLGSVLTAVGWFRAQHFDLGLTSWPAGRTVRAGSARINYGLTPLEPKISTGDSLAPVGRGGIPFLLASTFVRFFLSIAAMVALMALLMWWQSQKLSQSVALEMFVRMGGFMCCWYIVFTQLMSVLTHLRCLRTLPISAGRLAAVIVGMMILPLLALGVLMAGVVGWQFGTPAALSALSSYALNLASIALCVWLAVWLGSGRHVSILQFAAVFGFLMGGLPLPVFFHHQAIPSSLACAISAGCILLAVLLTRGALLRGGRSYRIQEVPVVGIPWWPTR